MRNEGWAVGRYHYHIQAREFAFGVLRKFDPGHVASKVYVGAGDNTKHNQVVLRITRSVADARPVRRREDGPMSHVRRFDHVGLTVADLDVVTAFFVALGLEVEGRTFVEGELLDTVCGPGVG